MAKLAKPVILFDSDDGETALFDNFDNLLEILHRIEVSPMTVWQREKVDKVFDFKSFWFHTLGGLIGSIDWDCIKIHIDNHNNFNVEYVNESGLHRIIFYRLVQGDWHSYEIPIGKFVKPYLKRRGYKW